MDRPLWKTGPSCVANLSQNGWTCQLDGHSPALSMITGPDFDGWKGRLLQPAFADRPTPDQPFELYQRGRDLVLRYPPRDTDQVRFDLYFNAEPDCLADSGLRNSVPLAVELSVSVQTDLLDSSPICQVNNLLGPGSLAPLADAMVEPIDRIVFHPRDTDFSILLSVHPSDFHTCVINHSRDAHDVTFTTFPMSLEKGVIRRARFLVAMLPRMDAEATARQLYDAFARSSPPLQT